MDYIKRSVDIFYSQRTQEQLYDMVLVNLVKDSVKRQADKIGIWQVEQYLHAKRDKELGGTGLCRSVTFDN